MQVRMKALQIIKGMSIAFYVMSLSCGVVFGNNEDERHFDIQIHDDLMTVKAKDIPLKDVLMEIANQINTKIVFLASAEELVVVDFSSLSQ